MVSSALPEVTRRISSLVAPLPSTTAGPKSPPLSRLARESSRRPDSAPSAPWQSMQRSNNRARAAACGSEASAAAFAFAAVAFAFAAVASAPAALPANPSPPRSMKTVKSRSEREKSARFSIPSLCPVGRPWYRKNTADRVFRRLLHRLKRTLGQQPAAETLRCYCREGCFDGCDVKAKSAVVVSSEMSCVSVDFVLYSGGRISSRMSSSGLSSISS